MATYFNLFFLFLTFQVHAWTSVYAPGVDKMLKEERKNGVFLSLKKSKDQFDLKNFNGQLYVKNLPLTRAPLLGFMGISDWKINRSQVILNLPFGQKGVLIYGDYNDGDQMVQFIEKHIFSETEFVQYQLVYPASKNDSRFENSFEDWIAKNLMVENSK